MNPQRKISFAKLMLLGTILTVGLSGCQSKTVRPHPTQPPVIAPSQSDVAGAVRYQIDSAASEVHILVYRGGTMARMGHNHVVSSKSVSGTLQLHSDIARSQLSLAIPVASLIVDDPQARASEGDDFTAEVPVEAREGTHRNLMRPEVLDVEQFPEIRLQSIAVSGTHDTPSLLMRVTIKGVARDVVVLSEVDDDGNRLVAEGEFTIQQSDFGIKPFSVGMGALQVQDKLRIRFRIVARS
jgi:polyisoprenoid-binding protein YceI